MPAIMIMIGTSPAVYSIRFPLPKRCRHIPHGAYPAEDTRVTSCYPPIPRPSCRLDEGTR